MKTLGICIGSSSISLVGLKKTGDVITEEIKLSAFHNGNVKKEFERIFNQINYDRYDKICVTGRKFKSFLNLTSISEPEAVEYAIKGLGIKEGYYNAVASVGGETTLIYQLNAKGNICNVLTNNKCASGTGTFFIQQLGRMGLSVENLRDEYSLDEVFDVSGRCSVFCKSDCTHALNKGIKKEKIVAGLVKMIAYKVTRLLSSLKEKRVILIGGVTKVPSMVKFIRDDVDDLHVPDQSWCFEAFGAACWAFENETIKYESKGELFFKNHSSFNTTSPLENAKHLVEFKTIEFGMITEDDICILGIDIGSTTTKAVLIRKSDTTILSSVYLRTDGDPIEASKKCYKHILQAIGEKNVKIVGLATTGSGRKIVGLHSLTKSIYNEIICHAAASVKFDPEVDTIFEIGGQDAKYTYITSGIPSDYAMNEACSAGTGSFLEEIGKESLNIDVSDIAELALESQNPVNFNDQCSAFISSDIMTAFQEKYEKKDIVAGIVIAVCKNYNNRVRGARPIGKKIFMQGGVCYNHAVPIAMASLLKVNIIVPPIPGYMGAYGAALELKKRLENNFQEEQLFNLDELANREIDNDESIICSGGKEKCDRKCKINIVKINGRRIPFGGACNKYFNNSQNIYTVSDKNDLVALREKMVFHEFSFPSGNADDNSKTIGINRSFLVNMLYPLYFNFWDQLGYKVVLPDSIMNSGIEKCNTHFCYPAEISHGFFENLLCKKCDYIFMPHVLHIPHTGCDIDNKTCVFVQGEPYYLKTAFKESHLPPIIAPVIDFQSNLKNVRSEFVNSAISIGNNKKNAEEAFDYGMMKLDEYRKKALKIGDEIIRDLEQTPDEIAVVLIGRWYNALCSEGNMSIPKKFASRGIKVIPFDFIPYNYENTKFHMHWGIGKINLQVAKIIKKHEQLFAAYITNFSCGPDSFIVQYFRDIMGVKPSLTLELDSHTADIGLDTRIEAALDIFKYFKKIEKKTIITDKEFVPAQIIYKKDGVLFIDSEKKEWKINDSNVTILVPAQGRFLTDSIVAALKGEGLNAKAIGIPDQSSLAYGKANTGCKECLPYTMTIGLLAKYIEQKKNNEKVAYFFAGDSNPCRVEQYPIGFRRFIEKNKIADVAVYSPSGKESFAGIDFKGTLKIWKTLCAVDAFEQIYTYLITHGINPKTAMASFNREWNNFLLNLEGKDTVSLEKRLGMISENLSQISVERKVKNSLRVTITGEVYVRTETFCRQSIEEKLGDLGLVAKIVPMIEWHYYINRILIKNYRYDNLSLVNRGLIFIQDKVQSHIETNIKKIFKKTGMYHPDPIDVKSIMKTSSNLIDNRLIGENSLTIGTGLNEVIDSTYGVISFLPFACLQGRLAEAMLKNNTNYNKMLQHHNDSKISDRDKDSIPVPFVSIEVDGNPFSQLIEARLEVFALQVKRFAEVINR